MASPLRRQVANEPRREKMRIWKSVVAAAAIALAAPVWAHGGSERGWGGGRGGDHHRWDRHDHRGEWRHHRHHHGHRDRASSYYGYERNYHGAPVYGAGALYGYAAPALAVPMVTPEIHIRFR